MMREKITCLWTDKQSPFYCSACGKGQQNFFRELCAPLLRQRQAEEKAINGKCYMSIFNYLGQSDKSCCVVHQRVQVEAVDKG